jgi:hypothetical protein
VRHHIALPSLPVFILVAVALWLIADVLVVVPELIVFLWKGDK